MATVELKVPDIGDMHDVSVIEVLVKPGDTIKAEQSLITLESDKASMEVPATQGGVIKELKVALGDKVSQGSVIALIEAAGAAVAAAEPAAAPAPVAPAASATPVPPLTPAPAVPALASSAPVAAVAAPAAAGGALPHASPSVRRFARELGVPLAQVPGTGLKGRITQEDVQGFVKGVMAGAKPASSAASGPLPDGVVSVLPWPQIDFTKFGPIERQPLSRIKKLSGANLSRNWVLIPHVTNNDEADITELEAFRVKLNAEGGKDATKVTMLAFLIKAVVAALKKFPTFNASLDGDALVLKQYFNIGFAADTPNGLVVPVIRDADKKGILELAQESADLAKLARDGKLTPAQMQGGCFSISSLGGIGGTTFTPIINAPEVAILGVCRSVMKPVWNGTAFEPRLTLPLSLSYDHRVIDGAAAARFNAYLGQLLADFRRVAL
ncbi:dihydrolipoyllysine-residue acetyltransferase [Aquabacterium sp.]|uniref:dihydrolipoyllysine-residue acetyltransferase n=1 Tax=Aquabacterium sp. TaxID=1872578 RepID=UPI0035B1DC8B